MTIAITHKGIGHLVESIGTGDTTMKLSVLDSQAFTNIDGDYIYALLRSPTDREIVRIDIAASQLQSGIITIARGRGGSTAAAWPIGSLVLATTNADHYNSILQAGDYRTIDYNPNEVLTPLHAGEKVYQNSPAGCERWWKSFNAVNPYWDIITGVACQDEAYEDIGWDYDLLIPGDPWNLKETLGDEDPAQSVVYSSCYDSARHMLWVGTGDNAQLWKSEDGGENWTLAKDLSNETNAQDTIRSLEYDAFHDVLVAGTTPDAQIWVSADGGATWTLKKDLQIIDGEYGVYGLGYDPNSHNLVAGTGFNDAKIYRSTDGGDTWTLVKDLSAETPAQVSVYNFTFDSSRNRLFACTGNDCQIWMSTDGGATWTLKKDLSNENSLTRWGRSMCYDVENDVVVIGTANIGQIWTSKDGGETWVLKKQLNLEGDPQTQIWSAVYNPVKKWIFVGTENDSQIWVSQDGGDTWAFEQDLGTTYCFTLTYDSYHLKTIAGLQWSGQIYQRGNA